MHWNVIRQKHCNFEIGLATNHSINQSIDIFQTTRSTQRKRRNWLKVANSKKHWNKTQWSQTTQRLKLRNDEF